MYNPNENNIEKPVLLHYKQLTIAPSECFDVYTFHQLTSLLYHNGCTNIFVNALVTSYTFKKYVCVRK